jgi:hypothetical protein
MKFINNNLLISTIAVFFVCHIPSFAQKNFLEAQMVLKDGERLTGLIDYREWEVRIFDQV